MDKDTQKIVSLLSSVMQNINFRPGLIPMLILNMDTHTKMQFFFMCEAYMQQLSIEWANGVGMQDPRMQPLGRRAYMMFNEGEEQ